MGLFSFLGGLLGSGDQKAGVNAATADQVNAYNRGIDEQGRQYDTSRADFMPYMEAGKSALGPIGDLIGLHGPEAAASAIASLKASPMYQSLFNTGQEAVLQNASATGGVRGGNTQGALYELGSNTLSQLISDQLSRLGGLAGMGEGATGSVAALGANKADALTKLFGNIGSAQASGDLTKAGINAQNWNNAGSFLDSAAKMIPGIGQLSALF